MKRAGFYNVSHLLFTDGMLVFCKAKSSIKGINNFLTEIQLNTELAINKDKGRLYFSAGCVNRNELKEVLQVSAGNLPVTYLGYLSPSSIIKPGII